MEERTDRGRFLRLVGVTLASGVGFAAFAGQAKAIGNCCRSTCDPGMTCPSGTSPFHCNCGGASNDYCLCHSGTNCYNGPC